jgi:fructose-1,6-bisphosphatase I
MLNILTSIKTVGIRVSKELRRPINKKNVKITDRNRSGDLVKPMDTVANDIFINELSNCNNIYELYSEENEYGLCVNNLGEYIIAFDPLDGSDNIDINNPVGSLFCVFEKDSTSGRGILMSGYIYYGNVTQLVVAMDGVVKLYNLMESFVEDLSDGQLTVPYSGNTYSNNDGNNYKLYNDKIKDFIDVMMWTKSLRYSGCLVADLHRLLFRGGCFIYPENKDERYGKLRLLYEAYPAAHILECAGGFSRHNESTQSILDIPFPDDIHQKTPVILMGNSEKEIYDALK